MATATTTDGTKIDFDPGAVVAVTGSATATVYGLAAAKVEINETPAGFVNRIGPTLFARLTRPDDSALWINGKSVSAIRAPLPDEYPETARAVVLAGTFKQAVEETPDQARTEVNGHGGSL